MVFTELELAGVFLIELERQEDQRGFFARSWCQEEFLAHGLNPRLVQCNVSWNERRGTLRGLHYQAAPHEEAKLVRCTRGSVYDVVLDLRPHSPTVGRWMAKELRADRYHQLYIPEGCAYGFQTLEDDTEVFYQMSERYHAESARGVRWNDAAFNIAWPLEPTVMSEKDRAYPMVHHVA